MNDFYDFMSIDATQWGEEIDPLGIMTYQNYKRKRSFDEATEELDEVLTLQQRMKRKILMRRLAPRIARARKISMRKRASVDVLKRRAMGLARRTMATKLLGGRSKADVSTSEKARVEKVLASRKKGIERLAMKLLPIVRKKQALRFKNKATKAKPTASQNKAS